MRLILSHFIQFSILGTLPKSFISDFCLKSKKTPYKEYSISMDDTVDSKEGF